MRSRYYKERASAGGSSLGFYSVGLLTATAAFLVVHIVYLGLAQKRREPVVASGSSVSVVWAAPGASTAGPSPLSQNAREFYVSPAGRPNGTGKIEAPWDLRTALNHPARVRPGDVIWLRGGVYRGSFTSQLTGTPEAPIVLRQYPGEQAVIDGNWTTKLSAPMTAAQTSFSVDDSSSIQTGGSVIIEGEEIRIVGKVVGNTVEKCARGAKRSTPSAHGQGATVRTSDTTLTIKGAHTWYWGFEVLNSNPERANGVRGSHPPGRRGTGITVYAPGSKLINLVVHDTGQGVGFFAPAVDAEVYGCLIYNNGWEAPDRGHGHGIYTQNESGTKQVRDNILFGNFGRFAIHCYGSDQARLLGYEFVGNTVFENDWLIGGGTPAGRMTVAENYLYGRGLRLGYGNRRNEDATVRGNYVYGALPLGAYWWRHLTVRGNSFLGKRSGQGGSVTLRLREDGQTGDHTFDENHYVNGRSGMDRTFSVVAGDGLKEDYFFSEWQQLGFDVHGTFVTSGGSKGGSIPTGTKVFARQNQYEPRRVTVTVFNWDLAKEISIDLSSAGFKVGKKYEIRNALDYFGKSAITRTYDGREVTIPMYGWAVTEPLGAVADRNPEATPEFNVFIISKVD